jgi:hypothetical protein
LESHPDRDWILAMTAALGTDSQYMVPIVPSVDAFRQLFAALRAAPAVPREPVAWMVGSDPDTAATYPRAKRDEAYDAARRWGRSVTALVVHPDAPTLTPPMSPAVWLLERGQEEGQVPTLWWCKPGRGDFKYSRRWTEDANKAHRFESWSAAYRPYDEGKLSIADDAPVDGDGICLLCHPTEHVFLNSDAAPGATPAVPREPTEAMLEACRMQDNGSNGTIQGMRDRWAANWRAMYDAAPGASHG